MRDDERLVAALGRGEPAGLRHAGRRRDPLHRRGAGAGRGGDVEGQDGRGGERGGREGADGRAAGERPTSGDDCVHGSSTGAAAAVAGAPRPVTQPQRAERPTPGGAAVAGERPFGVRFVPLAARLKPLRHNGWNGS
ncbi:hypothetical protein GCM10025868_34310 [Angustibacter aerolatus]|uniref:Uncharacterized protein n=1 Tax=Angustibacter aerolatus TaxID=1162965 RepID=A0ABQ6JIU8_9ACTN|nr:hypothetical protein GCM10025868_34310 [Angustibacter aerolatus]